MKARSDSMVSLSIRIPKEIHKIFVAEVRRRPYLSMNAVIVEALTHQFESEKEKKTSA